LVFPTVELVEALQAEMIDRYGGSHGLRDRGLLESAVARADNTAYYNPEASVGEVAASLAWGLIKNHAFIDGNKRVGFSAMVAFLEMNEHRLTCSEAEETAMVLRVAAGEITEDGWTAWVVENVRSV
jgi:death-on-curing protein